MAPGRIVGQLASVGTLAIWFVSTLLALQNARSGGAWAMMFLTFIVLSGFFAWARSMRKRGGTSPVARVAMFAVCLLVATSTTVPTASAGVLGDFTNAQSGPQPFQPRDCGSFDWGCNIHNWWDDGGKETTLKVGAVVGGLAATVGGCALAGATFGAGAPACIGGTAALAGGVGFAFDAGQHGWDVSKTHLVTGFAHGDVVDAIAGTYVPGCNDAIDRNHAGSASGWDVGLCGLDIVTSGLTIGRVGHAAGLAGAGAKDLFGMGAERSATQAESRFVANAGRLGLDADGRLLFGTAERESLHTLAGTVVREGAEKTSSIIADKEALGAAKQLASPIGRRALFKGEEGVLLRSGMREAPEAVTRRISQSIGKDVLKQTEKATLKVANAAKSEAIAGSLGRLAENGASKKVMAEAEKLLSKEWDFAVEQAAKKVVPETSEQAIAAASKKAVEGKIGQIATRAAEKKVESEVTAGILKSTAKNSGRGISKAFSKIFGNEIKVGSKVIWRAGAQKAVVLFVGLPLIHSPRQRLKASTEPGGKDLTTPDAITECVKTGLTEEQCNAVGQLQVCNDTFAATQVLSDECFQLMKLWPDLLSQYCSHFTDGRCAGQGPSIGPVAIGAALTKICLGLGVDEAKCNVLKDPEASNFDDMLLDIFMQNRFPVVSALPVVKVDGANSDEFGMPIIVNHGGWGLSCDTGVMRDIANMAHSYCFRDYAITGSDSAPALIIEYGVVGEQPTHEEYSQDDLQKAGFQTDTDGSLSFVPKVILQHGVTKDIYVTAAVHYVLVTTDDKGKAVAIAPGQDGALGEQTGTFRYTVTSDAPASDGGGTGTGGGGGGTGDGGGGCTGTTCPPCTGPDCTDPCAGVAAIDCGATTVTNGLGNGLGGLAKYWYVLIGLLAGVWVWRSGKLYEWTKGKLGRKPKNPLQTTKKPGLGSWIKGIVTGEKSEPKLKQPYLEDGVPVVAPANKAGTGPDYAALKRKLDMDEE